MASTPNVTEGRLGPGLPYLRLGEGPPLVMASALTSEHANPAGLMRRGEVAAAVPFRPALHGLPGEPQARSALRLHHVRHRR